MTRLFATLALASVSSIASAADKPLPVTVTNPVVQVEVTNADPIPVTGTTTVTGTVATRNIDEPGRAPYQEVGSCIISSTTPGRLSCGVLTKAVPAGKRLVVTNVNAVVSVSRDAIPFEMWLQCGNSYSRGTTPVSYLRATEIVSGEFQLNEAVVQYCEAGQDTRLNTTAIDTTRLEVVGKVTGYLVDLN